MKKATFTVIKKVFIGIIIAVFLCSALVGCGGKTVENHTHSYSQEWSSDETYHWHAAACEHTDEIDSKAEHNFSGGECTVCGRVKSGGSSDDEKTEQGYKVTFVCDDNVKVIVYKTQDYSLDGEETNIAYSRDGGTGTLLKDGDGQVNFKVVCDDGYEVLAKNIVIDGAYNQNKSQGNGIYRITKIESALTVSITATEKATDPDYNAYEKAQVLGVDITCESGTENCFTVNNNVITFGAVSEASVYAISGTLTGQIVIDIGDDYSFELSMLGLTVTSTDDCPIAILSGDKVTLSAKNGTANYVYDKRANILNDDSEYSSAIYSVAALNLQGKGSLEVVSDNNKGIHTKDDLSVKNLTLYVKCADNALKGNDGVTISSGTLTLIATGGDCVKTSNSDLSSKGNQKGTVTISGGTVKLYAACDGIDAAYDAQIGGDGTTVEIYTDKYSVYTGEIVQKSTTVMYLRMSSSNYSTSYRYAFYFYDNGSDFKWAEASYYKSVTSGSGRNQTTYHYYKVDTPKGYTNFKLYRFASSQIENSTETYNAATSGATINTDYDMFGITSISSSTRKINGSWGNYSNGNDYSSKGIKAHNEIKISGGTITIESNDDGIHCDYGTALDNGETGAGIVTISGGTITVSSLDDAIHSDYELYVNGGMITVTSSYEGLEANLIYINGGKIHVVATDDGINAGGKVTTPSITISGGYVDVTVGTGDCDGIDSNGSYTQTGGFVISRDPTSMTGGMASGLDIDGTCTITGGTFICAGAIGQTPSTSSECWVKFNSISFTAGTYSVTDSNGNELFTFTLSTSYKSMWIASDFFSTGNTYTVSSGATSKTWTQSGNSATVS